MLLHSSNIIHLLAEDGKRIALQAPDGGWHGSWYVTGRYRVIGRASVCAA